ncbi:ABC transporter permease [Haloechinothrix sp. YIM 98757]|uniref:ABC transporter permease n=1 Tax=Haloechinothrix aidingensis TaxID=2752311 RepID=A0A838ADT6_9PSEU|nr:ABC transporter permease subunit [Haloechinothrix aidingensis]MBA0127459.1 ABC transporter permease [Haloechinothrix aidingensis]
MIRLVRAEFDKTFSTKLWIWLLLGGIALMGTFMAFTIGFDGAEGNPSPPLSTPEGKRNLFATASAANTFALLLGIIAVTGEFRHQTVTPTFLATPHRGRVVTAKLAAYAVLGIAFGLVTIVAATAIALPWLAAIDIDLSMTSSGIPGTLAGVLAAVALYALLGVGVGALVRNQIAAVVGALVYLFVVEAFMRGLPVIRDYYQYLPGGASEALTATTDPVVEFLEPWQGGALLAIYALAFGVLGSLLSVRRDVT